jgi:hypothetical protein
VYADVGYARVRQTDRARKPSTILVRFAPGASSARLHGTASLGWYDVYVFDAAKGQRIAVDAVSPRSGLTATLFPPDGAAAAALHSGMPFTAPKRGAYRLHIEVDSETDVPYSLRFAIR